MIGARSLASLVAAAFLVGCSSGPTRTREVGGAVREDRLHGPIKTELGVQALAMAMADDWAAALAEASTLLQQQAATPAERLEAVGLLKDGLAGTFDAALGTNPEIALVDVLISIRLQRVVFERSVQPRSWGSRADPAMALLRRAEDELWVTAQRVLDAEQAEMVRTLCDRWVADHPDLRFVAFVRLADFASDRNEASPGMEQARGLFAEVSNVATAMDDARLFGERALWFAFRAPHLVGLQAEMTTYYMASQPEVEALLADSRSFADAAQRAAGTFASLPAVLAEEREALAEAFGRERREAIEHAGEALREEWIDAVDYAMGQVRVEREATIDHVAREFASQSVALLDQVEARTQTLGAVLVELQATLDASNTLAISLTGTVDAIDRVVARFDRDPSSTREPLDMKDVRDAAIETATAAREMTALLERTDATLGSREWAARIDELTHATDRATDRLFWRGLWLVLILLAGLAATRFIPARAARPASS